MGIPFGLAGNFQEHLPTQFQIFGIEFSAGTHVDTLNGVHQIAVHIEGDISGRICEHQAYADG